jgi:hypothetical protein
MLCCTCTMQFTRLYVPHAWRGRPHARARSQFRDAPSRVLLWFHLLFRSPPQSPHSFGYPPHTHLNHAGPFAVAALRRTRLIGVAVCGVAVWAAQHAGPATAHERHGQARCRRQVQLRRSVRPPTLENQTKSSLSANSIGASYQDNAHPRDAKYRSQQRPPPYKDGRFTNGPVAVEYLASTLKAALIDYA